MASPKIPRQRELLSPCIQPEFTQVGRSASGFFGRSKEGDNGERGMKQGNLKGRFLGISSL